MRMRSTIEDVLAHRAVAPALLTSLHALMFFVVAGFLVRPVVSVGPFWQEARMLAAGRIARDAFREQFWPDELGTAATLAVAMNILGERYAWQAYRVLNFLVANLGLVLFHVGCVKLMRGSQTRAFIFSAALALWVFPSALAKTPNTYSMATAWMMVFYGLLTIFFARFREASKDAIPLSRTSYGTHGLLLGACVALASAYRSQPCLLGLFLLPAYGAYMVLALRDGSQRRQALVLTAGFVVGQAVASLPTVAMRMYLCGQPRLTRPVFWHTVASGLGVYPHNGLQMPFWDAGIFEYVARMDPFVRPYSPRYEALLKESLLRHLGERPGDFLKAGVIRAQFLFRNSHPGFMPDAYSASFRVLNCILFLLSLACIARGLRGRCLETLPLIACWTYFYLSVLVVYLPAWSYVIYGTLAAFPMFACLYSSAMGDVQMPRDASGVRGIGAKALGRLLPLGVTFFWLFPMLHVMGGPE